MAGRRRRPPADPEVPMVFDGYYGGFVPVDAASFDVTLEPEAMVLLPVSVLDEQRAAPEALERRQQARAARRARPRCDAGDHHVQTVARAGDGLLALCSRCIEGVELTTLDSPAVMDVLVARVPEAERARRRRALERRLMARRHEHDLAIGGIGRCLLCGRFRRILQTRDGVLRVCRGCAQGVPLAGLDGRAAAQALAARRSPAHRAAFLAMLANRFPALPGACLSHYSHPAYVPNRHAEPGWSDAQIPSLLHQMGRMSCCQSVTMLVGDFDRERS